MLGLVSNCRVEPGADLAACTCEKAQLLSELVEACFWGGADAACLCIRSLLSGDEGSVARPVWDAAASSSFASVNPVKGDDAPWDDITIQIASAILPSIVRCPSVTALYAYHSASLLLVVV